MDNTFKKPDFGISYQMRLQKSNSSMSNDRDSKLPNMNNQ